ncbi:MAG: aminotransferase class I/II-fold pyridoxal phosphate-dependent enzyme, partial [Candidatus Zixiibacteriota bacterium]
MPSPMRDSAEVFQLKETLSRRLNLDPDSICLYQEAGEFLTRLFSSFDSSQNQLIAAAPVIPEIAIAADRAEMELVQIESANPCAAEIDSLKRTILSRGDIVYLANPNRLTGATFSIKHLRTIAGLVNQGLLIIDEFYHDFSGLSAFQPVKECDNVIVLRPFQDWNEGLYTENGFAIISKSLGNRIDSNNSVISFSRWAAKKCLEIVNAKVANESQVKKIQKRSFEIAIELAEFGIKSQLLPTDSILLQLPIPQDVLRYLSERDVNIEPVGESEQLKNYLHFQITGKDKDKALVNALAAMPESLKRAPDSRKTMA